MATRLANPGFHLDRGVRHSPFDIAMHTRFAHADVVLDLGIELRRAVLDGLVGVNDRRKLLIIDLDQIGGIARDLYRLGNHRRDGISDVAHLLDGQWLDFRNDMRIDSDAAFVVDLHAGVPRGMIGIEILEDVTQVLAIHHVDDTRQRQRRRFVDPLDVGVGIGAAHEDDMRHATQLDVIGIGRGTGNKPRVFFPFDRRADVTTEHHGCELLRSSIHPSNWIRFRVREL